MATASELAWDEKTKDWAAGAPVPPAQRGAFRSEPRWLDLIEISLHHRLPVIPAERLAEIAAPNRGMAKDTLFGEHPNGPSTYAAYL